MTTKKPAKTAKKKTTSEAGKKTQSRAGRFVDKPGEDNLGPIPKK